MQRKHSHKLTDYALNRLSDRLTKEDIRRLGIKLGINMMELDTVLNSPPAREAAQHILTKWLKKQKRRVHAKQKLRDALSDEKVGLTLLIEDVLDN